MSPTPPPPWPTRTYIRAGSRITLRIAVSSLADPSHRYTHYLPTSEYNVMGDLIASSPVIAAVMTRIERHKWKTIPAATKAHLYNSFLHFLWAQFRNNPDHGLRRFLDVPVDENWIVQLRIYQYWKARAKLARDTMVDAAVEYEEEVEVVEEEEEEEVEEYPDYAAEYRKLDQLFSRSAVLAEFLRATQGQGWTAIESAAKDQLYNCVLMTGECWGLQRLLDVPGDKNWMLQLHVYQYWKVKLVDEGAARGEEPAKDKRVTLEFILNR